MNMDEMINEYKLPEASQPVVIHLSVGEGCKGRVLT